MNNYDEFTKLYPIQKTIRFELKPQGRTMEHLETFNFFEEDRDRAEKYKILKEAIDEYHKKFIDEHLTNMSLDWNSLKQISEKYYKSREEKDKKVFLSEQKRMRQEIVSEFKKDDRFKDLFSKKLFSELLKEEIYKKGNHQEIDALKSFDKFSGYFIGLHENRKNMYSDGDEITAISNRIVNENFPKFLDNLQKYQEARKKYPEWIIKAESALVAHNIKMDEVFSLEYFNKVLNQEGIQRYNLALGGYVTKSGEKMMGLNDALNLAHQSEKSSKGRIHMTPLFKQILSEKESFSYIPDVFTEDSQLLPSIGGFFAQIENDKDGNIFDRALELISSYAEYDTERIYIRQADINRVSNVIFGEWGTLGGLMREYKADSINDINLERTCKKVDKWLDSKEFALSDVLEAIKRTGNNDAFNEYISKMRTAREKIDAARKEMKFISEKISGDEESIHIIKTLLDSVQQFLHFFNLFKARQDIPLDGAFYAEFDEVHSKLFAIVPLYNKVRNYLTKNNLNTKKIKLNFKNPTLANGWDQNKVYDYASLIFLRDGNYYLGIINPKRKKNIKFEQGSGNGPFYRKMVYKQIPGPNKNLPRVFLTSTKGKKEYKPSKEIIEGYEADKHIRGDKFDLDFCHKLIDFFKESIEKHKDWSKFNFYFSPTESYGDISEFYLDVEKQGYRMHFENISAETIDEYVEKGDLFLFQIYNKDFVKAATGKKDMHTIYWNAAFSPENLQDVVVKLNGEAELFYRDKSDIKEIVHREGEILVNRTYNGRTPVPDKIHKKLTDYHNGRTKDLGEAKEYLDKVRYFKAHYDITKDRRYLNDKIYFHVPLTLNFKANGKKNLNKMVIEKFLSDEKAHIIGIDRGERNLLYYSIIDRSGKIIDQQSLNVIDGFDYREKLNQREIEMKDARQSWNAIGKIKDLKEGYLSKAVHEITKMAIQYNAIVVMEELNYGFKRGRFKVEKQIYQKFENMLIDKMNYLVFKDAPDESPGGVLNAYQLTNPLESFAKLGKQTGILFYVPAAYTSKIDPTTGFVNLFNTSSKTNAQERKEFLQKFESISYSAKDGGIFAFAFDYRKFGTSKTDHKNVWTAYTNGERMRYIKEKKRNELFDPSKEIKEALTSSGIKYDGGQNILPDILRSNNNGLIYTMYSSFIAAIQMRVYDGKEDYIISPIKNSKGEFFRTDPKRRELPIDADANGAYNIALRGELTMRAIAEKFDPDSEKMAKLELKHKDWFEFMQTRGD
ncbi:hypothetical protein Mpt1_c09950 [Candidatus Methanoplasma termitum]|uniref:Type V CRISPR-associated protein Cpf1 n=1 Tax=Candidatus Methanoplasma termitum TaxID=1577791 RepID=A0A0A7LCY1_9ARCH|nr:type V CRISPR-associated protein Cas12a/Cpf1 [Candidatus Methanoplasma termitum]AIZ56868.1 hypothetical protein Mpt1_c09950 [Candidatus Methanoplasma termitum]